MFVWFPISGIPAEGRQFEIAEQTLFLDLIREYGLACEIVQPLKAEFFVLPQEEGCFVRGKITGEVSLPCNRCAEKAVVAVQHGFESFEPYPSALPRREEKNRPGGKRREERGEPLDIEDSLDVDEAVIRYNPKLKGMEINLAALAWEEFVLSLPVKPLCNSQCKGICPQCGQNLNQAECACRKERGDPRLDALLNLKITKK